jgi:CheY-like chemotaxis protein
MPKMTGTELAKVIKDEWPDIPVLLATGYADRDPRDDIGLPRLAKPYLQRDLSDAIEQMNPPRPKADRDAQPGATVPQPPSQDARRRTL